MKCLQLFNNIYDLKRCIDESLDIEYLWLSILKIWLTYYFWFSILNTIWYASLLSGFGNWLKSPNFPQVDDNQWEPIIGNSIEDILVCDL